MSIIDAVFIAALQARHHFQLLLAVPHFDGVGADAHVHPFADESRRHRVDVPLDGDRAARLHPHPQHLERLQTPRRQRLQAFAFVIESLLSFGVAAFTQFAQKHLVRFPVREVVAATQQQRLLHRSFEAMMTLLAVTVLMA